MKRWLLHSLALLFALGMLGGVVMLSGVVPITASSGHAAITAWLLELAKQRSVATHTLFMDAPSLDESWLVLKGAGHYETGCRPCHGSPGSRPPSIAQAMTPHPPALAPRIAKWEPEELFYIVKHGIKFTGMPAWVAQTRDDEVHAMVAFLRELPKLDEQAYGRLVHGETQAEVAATPLVSLLGRPQPSRALLARCARCHGVDGMGRGMAAFPKLAGQRSEYLYESLRAFANGQRHSGIMQPIAAALSLDEMRTLAVYYAALKAPSASEMQVATSSTTARGREIALHGDPLHRVPSCKACHGPTEAPRNPHYPLLAGQYAYYLELQLQLFKATKRGGTAYAKVMHPGARLTSAQMREVALFYAALPAN